MELVNGVFSMVKTRKFVSFKDSDKVQELLKQLYGNSNESEKNRRQPEPDSESISGSRVHGASHEHGGKGST